MEFERDPETGGIRIPLSSKRYPGLIALVDRDDVPLVAPYLWTPVKHHTRGRDKFIVRSSHYGRPVSMHRLIMAINDPAILVDHVNGDSLDNRRSNLRGVTNRQNQHNRLPQQGTSRFKGVYWHRDRKKWAAAIQVEKRKRYLGYFRSEEEAARAYDEKARELFGEFAYLNFPEAAS